MTFTRTRRRPAVPAPPAAAESRRRTPCSGSLLTWGGAAGRGKVSGAARREGGRAGCHLPRRRHHSWTCGRERLPVPRSPARRYILSFLCCSPATRHKMCFESDISRSAESVACVHPDCAGGLGALRGRRAGRAGHCSAATHSSRAGPATPATGPGRPPRHPTRGRAAHHRFARGG